MHRTHLWTTVTIAAALMMLGGRSRASALDHPLLAKYTSAGVPDPNWGIGGFIITQTATSAASVSVLTQTNSNLITTGGYFYDANGVQHQLITRSISSGVADTSFGYFGVTTADFPGSLHEAVVDIEFDRNFKILAAVEADGTASNGWLVERFNTNGALDGTFGFGGYAGVFVANNTDVRPASIANYVTPTLIPGQFFAVAGTVYDFNNSDIVVSLHGESGAVLNTFGTNGVARINIGSNDQGFAVAFDQIGRILVAGTTVKQNKTLMSVVCLKQNGQLDTAFGDVNPSNPSLKTGIATLDFPGSTSSTAFAMQVDRFQRIVVAGIAPNASGARIAVGRLTFLGQRDTTFGEPSGSARTGMKVTTVSGASAVFASSVIVTYSSGATPTDDKITLAGTGIFSGLERMLLVRYKNNGDLDPGWGTGGIRHENFAPRGTRAYALANIGPTFPPVPIVVGVETVP